MTADYSGFSDEAKDSDGNFVPDRSSDVLKRAVIKQCMPTMILIAMTFKDEGCTREELLGRASILGHSRDGMEMGWDYAVWGGYLKPTKRYLKYAPTVAHATSSTPRTRVTQFLEIVNAAFGENGCTRAEAFREAHSHGFSQSVTYDLWNTCVHTGVLELVICNETGEVKSGRYRVAAPKDQGETQ